MTDIGVEVGQKMRLAIKAKLTELNCYADDELPDYIMVMIANKRTKAQMKEDLSLFLSNETSSFVEWLHIVLKKLKQVHVTNPNVFKNSLKRKVNEFGINEDEYKKVKKEEDKVKKEIKPEKSLTDDLPITATKLSQATKRKIVLLEPSGENLGNSAVSRGIEDFDIPLLSEINTSSEEELQRLEKKISDFKSRLGIQVQSEEEESADEFETSHISLMEEEDCLTIKPDPGDMEFQNQSRQTPPRLILQHSTDEAVEDSGAKRGMHTKITFDKDKDSLEARYNSLIRRTTAHREALARTDKSSHAPSKPDPKKRSILDRLGKRPDIKNHRTENVKSRVSRPARESTYDKKNASSILSKVGIMSRVSIPQKTKLRETVKDIASANEVKPTVHAVQSVVKIKPRQLPEKTKQANPSLLLKAMAEAQRSMHQTASVGVRAKAKTVKKKQLENEEERAVKQIFEPPALFTKKYREQMCMTTQKGMEDSACDFNEPTGFECDKILVDEMKLKMSIANKESIAKVNEARQIRSSDSIELNFDNHFNENLITNSPLKERKIIENIDKSNEESTFILKNKRNITIERRSTDATGVQTESEKAVTPALQLAANQQFIVTLDGIEKHNFSQDKTTERLVKCVLNFPEKKIRRAPSPIVYDKTEKPIVAVAPTTSKSIIVNKKPEIKELPLPASPVKKNIREKCKYYPGCKLGARCEYLHPSMCKMFPNCKFADQCLYAHPVCKFEMSCTRKNCPYSHTTKATLNKVVVSTSSSIVCKYHPNCVNASCIYLHPTMCKYGAYCNNQQCLFYHPERNKNSRTWRSDQ